MSADTGFEVIDGPRSAWIVCGTTPLRVMALVRKSFATTASSVLATSHPVTYREKMSRTTYSLYQSPFCGPFRAVMSQDHTRLGPCATSSGRTRGGWLAW